VLPTLLPHQHGVTYPINCPQGGTGYAALVFAGNHGLFLLEQWGSFPVYALKWRYYSFATRGLGPTHRLHGHVELLVMNCSGAPGLWLSRLPASVRYGQDSASISVVADRVLTLRDWTFTHFGVQLSVRDHLFGWTRATDYAGARDHFLIHPDPVPVILPRSIRRQRRIILAGGPGGMVFSILSLSGLKGGAVGAGIRRAGKFVGQAVLLSLAVTGLFYVLLRMPAPSAGHWEYGGLRRAIRTPTMRLAISYGMDGGFVVLALINKPSERLATTKLGLPGDVHHGQAGTLPSLSGAFIPCTRHPRSPSPWCRSSHRGVLLVGWCCDPVYIFGLLETIATLAVIIIYCVANLALTATSAANTRKIQHLAPRVSPWIGTLALLPVLFVTMYPPSPEWP